MPVIGSNILAGASGQGATGVDVGTYTGKSLIFNKGSNHDLNRTWGAAASDLDSFTISMWIKRANVDSGSTQYWLVGASTGAESNIKIQADKINIHLTGSNYDFVGTRLLRDTSAFYHLVFRYDSDEGSAGDRFRCYINGELETWASSSTIPSGQDNEFLANTNRMEIGNDSGTNHDFDGYMAAVNVIDGASLAPASFGETSSDTGAWIIKDYSGSHGNNGLYLDFSDADSTTVTDNSANSNAFTATNYGSDVDGYYVDSTPVNNFWTLNSLIPVNAGSIGSGGTTYYRGSTANHGTAYSTPLPSTGKWYIECDVGASANNAAFGIADTGIALIATGTEIGGGANDYIYRSDGNKKNNGSSVSTDFGSWSTGSNSILSIAWDADNGKVWFALDGTWQGAGSPNPATGADEAYASIPNKHSYSVAMSSAETDASDKFLFGATPSAQVTIASSNTDDNDLGSFEYAPPSGFLALCTSNLPEIEIGQESGDRATDYFKVTLFTGDGTSTRDITGTGFDPALNILKMRSSADNHVWTDAERGTNHLHSNTGDADSDLSYPALITDGFRVDAGTYNNDTETFVVWQWKAGTNFDNDQSTTGIGTIDSDGQINEDAGFSIVNYDGTGSVLSWKHGLSSAPDLVIVKNRDQADSWNVQHSARGGTKVLYLNAFTAESDQATRWNDTNPTSSVVTIGTIDEMNTSGENYIAYCWHSVEGYSKFGSYIGNANANGTFVHTGFPVAFTLIRRYDGTSNWYVHDSTRDTTNPRDNNTIWDSSNAEGTSGTPIDFLSNGFKFVTSDSNLNQSGANYIYMAFSSGTGFKYANAI